MKKLMIGIAVLILSSWSITSYAQNHWGNHGNHTYYHYHDHPHFGVHVSAFYPDEYYPVLVGDNRYYYDDGVYYDYAGGTYVVAQPPVGAVVGTIPSDFQPVVINGTTYYTADGSYYVYTSSGYKVVSPPAQNSFVINVPTNNGGYAAVTIKKSGNGYVGPQGEFYTNFPQVSQLRVMYGK